MVKVKVNIEEDLKNVLYGSVKVASWKQFLAGQYETWTEISRLGRVEQKFLSSVKMTLQNLFLSGSFIIQDYVSEMLLTLVL